jgi:dTDP-4-amino-4,6-dideoxygalactose transaminase
LVFYLKLILLFTTKHKGNRLIKNKVKKIPFFSIHRQCSKLKIGLPEKIEALYNSNNFVGGPYVSNFEKKFSKYLGSPHAISCNSGTDAIWLALKALNLKPNSIVLTTPFSFIASSSEIISHNSYPVFIDVDESYNISPHKIELWLKSNAIIRNNETIHKKKGTASRGGLKISGIIVVDLFGQPADYDSIKSIAKKWNLWIIEDACQAAGSRIGKKKAGTFGDIGCFSLYPTKNLGVFGDGGVLTTNNKNLAEILLKLRNHGRKSHYNYEFYGRNSRLDAIQALIATEKLKILDSLNDRRREIANKYTKRLSKLPFIKVPKEKIGHHIYHQYSIQVCNRDFLQKFLEGKGVGTNIFYPKALNEISYLVPKPELDYETPVAKSLTKNILALPIWPELTNDEVDYICECVEEAQGHVARGYSGSACLGWIKTHLHGG